MLGYPPDSHLLRDLQLSFDHVDDGPSRAWMPIVPEICGDDGTVRIGALTTLVDVVGGGLAARAAHPNWIATADLTVHLFAPARAGRVEALARTVRAGRTTVVLEVDLRDDERDVGIATMSFSALPRRDSNPDIAVAMQPGPTTMADAASRIAAPLCDLAGIEIVDAAAGVVELPVLDWAKNSMGALQGGVVGLVVEMATEAAARAATGRSLAVTDIQCSYLAFGKVGPLRTRTDVLACDDGHVVTRVELIDDGAESRRMTVARAVATESLR